MASGSIDTQTPGTPTSTTDIDIGAISDIGSNVSNPGYASIPPAVTQKYTSAGFISWTDSTPRIDDSTIDKNLDLKLNRKESYKAQRKTYRLEKKRVASELFHSYQDPGVIVLTDWLKVRGTLKSWTKLWCILKPGLLFLYKSPKTKSSHWVGTVILTSCQLIERPSKKNGFCFKLFHPMDQTIWASRGPEKETIGAVTQPLPTSSLIFRAPSQAAGKCWMDALELSLRCSALLLRSNSNSGTAIEPSMETTGTMSHETQWSEADYKKHFEDHDLETASQNENDDEKVLLSGFDTDSDTDVDECTNDGGESETPYIHSTEDEFGAAGEQVEELADEHKSLIWFLVKQVRPGMDLSKVVLPTFILEPRSFLDKLSDSYYHADYLSQAVLEDDPFTRMKTVVQWYLSGFYKKPKGLKKPYNPILGETFRCYWQHDNGSKTFYIAEQVSHHPPISAFYVTNRQDGFCISCSILAKSKFYGNSTSAILEGIATLTLLPRGESYTLTTPYAHCKGILMGTLSMELGGKIKIECENTRYSADLEFKLKPFLGGSEYINVVTGRIKLGKETFATINGHWDGSMTIRDSRNGEESSLFNCTSDVKSKRLKRYTVPIENQAPNESERLWQNVSVAIRSDDQNVATEEKTILEEMQRAQAKERKATCTDWNPTHFEQNIITGQWVYKYADLRPWDPRNDVRQYENNYRILTKTKHQAPMVRTASIVSTSDQIVIAQTDGRITRKPVKYRTIRSQTSNASTSDMGNENNSDSSQSNDCNFTDNAKTLQMLQKISVNMETYSRQLAQIALAIDRINDAPSVRKTKVFHNWSYNVRTFAWIGLGLLLQTIVMIFIAKN